MRLSPTLSRREFLALSAGLLAVRSVRGADPVADVPLIGLCASFDGAGAARDAGVGYIEESFQRLVLPNGDEAQFEAKLQAVTRAALPVYSCNGFLPGELKVVGPKADHDGVIRYVQAAFPRARRIGMKVVVFGSGKSRQVPDGFAPAEAMKQMIALGRRLAAEAAKHDLTVAIETLNRDECNFLNRVAEVAEIVAAVNDPHLAITADLYHMAREDDGPGELEKVVRHVRHMHIAEKEKRTAPGTAGFDFSPWFRVLRHAGYAGRMSLECGWKDRAAELPRAVRTLQDQWRAAAG